MMSDRITKARLMNGHLKTQKRAVVETIPQLMNDGIEQAKDNVDATRKFASSVSLAAPMIPTKEWAVGLITNPGDLVFDPDHKYRYVFTGSSPMVHNNKLFYPGAQGVYYWAIIPNVLDGVKVYPDIPGIIVSVRKDEIWWNVDHTAKYKWVGESNSNCVWPPVEGNEWSALGKNLEAAINKLKN